MIVALVLWYLITIVQVFFAYGTVYRLTKAGGDNGVALFGWFLVMQLASLVPGLGIFLWLRYKDSDREIRYVPPHSQGTFVPPHSQGTFIPPSSQEAPATPPLSATAVPTASQAGAEKTCGDCGTKNPVNGHFCIHCGKYIY